jgi:hypothetical protein
VEAFCAHDRRHGTDQPLPLVFDDGSAWQTMSPAGKLAAARV